MTDYVISEDELKEHTKLCVAYGATDNVRTVGDLSMKLDDMDKTIRSRPLSSALKKMNRILEHKRGCLTCRSPDCPVWQSVDQNCWKSQKAHDAQVAKQERENTLNEFMKAIDWRFNDTEKGRIIIKTIQEIKNNLPQNDYPDVDRLQEFPFRHQIKRGVYK